jgi:hypothetical protein
MLPSEELLSNDGSLFPSAVENPWTENICNNKWQNTEQCCSSNALGFYYGSTWLKSPTSYISWLSYSWFSPLSPMNSEILPSLWDFKFSRRRVWSSDLYSGMSACTLETSVDNYFTRQYIPEDKSELRTRRRENFKISQSSCGLSQSLQANAGIVL